MVHGYVVVDDGDVHIKKQLISNTNVTLGCLCCCIKQGAVTDKSLRTPSRIWSSLGKVTSVWDLSVFFFSPRATQWELRLHSFSWWVNLTFFLFHFTKLQCHGLVTEWLHFMLWAIQPFFYSCLHYISNCSWQLHSLAAHTWQQDIFGNLE